MYCKQDDGYPLCAALLRAALPFYEPLQPRVFRLFVKRTRSEKLARQALTLGYYPLISIAKIMTGGQHDRTKNGLYQGANGGARDIVYVNTPFPDSYEKEQRQSTAQTIEITVLHEMVHCRELRAVAAPPRWQMPGGGIRRTVFQICNARVMLRRDGGGPTPAQISPLRRLSLPRTIKPVTPLRLHHLKP